MRALPYINDHCPHLTYKDEPLMAGDAPPIQMVPPGSAPVGTGPFSPINTAVCCSAPRL